MGRVLVIDDDRLFATAVERILNVEHEVLRLESAEAALACLQGGASFDVILCDLMMPEMSGMEFHAALTGLDPEQARRVVFLTGGAFTTAVRGFLESIPNPHIEKPFDIVRLRGLIADRVG